ncbi:MAG: polysaccharide biosynthesis C-terminal domain-containing protein, partial [Oscillospiraceae bacterium]|nr:polysaccharide biosynthesis C-terminal domain-containing protein [Oscillospiraceae bacterium]
SASVLAGGLFFLYGEELALVLYHDPEPGRYIRALGPVMPFVYMESMVDGALKGLGEQMAVFRYNLWDSLLRIAGILIFLPRYGMAGLLGVMAVSNVFLCLLCCRRMLAVSGAKARWGGWLVWPAVLLLPGLWAGLQAAGRMESSLGRLCAGGAATAAVYLLFCLPGEAGRTLLRALKKKKEPPPA